MPRLTTGAVGALLLTASLLLVGCGGSGNSSGQSEQAAEQAGGVNTVDDFIGLSTGGERESANYRLRLNVSEAAVGGIQQRASGSYHLTVGIGAAQQVELGE